MSDFQWLGAFAAAHPFQSARMPGDATNVRLALLTLEVCRDHRGAFPLSASLLLLHLVRLPLQTAHENKSGVL